MILFLLDMDKNVILQLKDASFNYQGEETLFENLKLTMSEGDVSALVGINGAGKSTLLKLLIGELELNQGEMIVNCKPYYVPQVDLTIQQGEITVGEYIEQFYEEWWELSNETEKLFGMELDYSKKARMLSGGELMKLNLAIALINNPDLLILDEPTNHLDVKSINNLVNFIKTNNNKYTFLIVSHDTYFLDQVVTKIFNLENGKINTYGGNYSFYEEQKALQLKGVKKRETLARKNLEKAQAQAQKEYEKQEHKIAKVRKDIHEGKIQDKYQIGKMKETGASTAKAKITSFERLEKEAEDMLNENELEKERKLAVMYLKNSTTPENNLIFDIKGADLDVVKNNIIKKINWRVNYGDRVVISGDNGTGKTSLIKALLKLGKVNTKDTNLGNALLTGDVEVNEALRWVYIDQHYTCIHPDKTLIENLMEYNSQYTKDKAKEQLGKFRFSTPYEMNKLGKSLSGGELVRVVMAMITAFPIDLIVLDEPTNNLDVATVEILSIALKNFRGAIIVISHNIDFLNDINIETSYIIKDQKLELMNVTPKDRDAYYKTLLE